MCEGKCKQSDINCKSRTRTEACAAEGPGQKEVMPGSM